MDESASHFDSTLGGNQTLPSTYNVSEFLKERMEEVMMLTECIQESPFRGQTFQRLPKHMRRRQMSHHIKRLPRKLQRPYLMSLKEGLPKPTKCPSRKYRRRPGNLLEEYNRRQRLNVWLETHIWHAKRFHMVKKWGYCLPEAPTNKSFRACYRAISEHCLVTDVSYYNCIELKGSEMKILKGLMRCTSSECGLTFGAKMYLYGTREGSLTFYHPDSYPYKVIGNVKFLWKAPVSGDSERSIWLWVHPLIHNEMIECLINLFNLKQVNNYVMNADKSDEIQDGEENVKIKKKRREKRKKNNVEKIKLKTRNVPFDRTPKYHNECENVSMSLLKDTLNRFQLTGPLSQAIISQAFSPIAVDVQSEESHSNKKEEDESLEILEEIGKKRTSVGVDGTGKSKRIKKSSSIENLNERKRLWWEEYYEKSGSKENWKLQKDFYEKLSETSKPTDVPPGLVLSLVVGDPRLMMPKKREKAITKINEPRQIYDDLHTTHLSDSPIWDSDVRDEVSMSKLTTQEINEARSRKIVPGYDADDIIPDEKKSRIPILLIQRPGVRDHKSGKSGLGSGWDIISPAGFGMPIWLALVFRGARCGGLREFQLLSLESKNLSNFLEPDSLGGKINDEEKRLELEKRHFGLPPNKRPNYVKLGVPTPFHSPWQVLADEWTKIANPHQNGRNNRDFYVLRCKKSLGTLKDAVESCLNGKCTDLDEIMKNMDENCLVPVSIECSGKGKPKELAMICMPEVEDFPAEEETWNFSLVEKIHEDENTDERKKLKSDHSKLLASLRRKRKKTRFKLKEDFANNLPNKLNWKEILNNNSAPSDKFVEEYKKKMESLWIPSIEKINSLVHFPTRKIMGFLIKGDFTFSKSVSTGLGYVSMVALFEWLKIVRLFGQKNRENTKVIIRNSDQVQYRLCKLTVLLDYS